MLDELIYQTIIIGFLLLTVGIATGAIWAHSAWGTYWSWDPKETWSLITWLLYAALLACPDDEGLAWDPDRLAFHHRICLCPFHLFRSQFYFIRSA